MLDEQGESKTLRSATIEIGGLKALTRRTLEAEAGEHIVQRKTKSRRKDRIHTSEVSVRVLDVVSVDAPSLDRLRRETALDYFRASGPGGQHKNKTETAVRAVHGPTKLTATISSGRSKPDNTARALRLLAARIAAANGRRVEAEHGRRRSGQAGAVRTYDFVRGMIRCADGTKTRALSRVMNGDLDLLA